MNKLSIIGIIFALLLLIPSIVKAGPPIVGVSGCSTLSASNTIYKLTGPITTTGSGTCLTLSGNHDTVDFHTYPLSGSGAATTTGTGLAITGTDNLVEGYDANISGFSVGVLDTGTNTMGDDFNFFPDGVGLEMEGITDNWTSFTAFETTKQGVIVNNCRNGCSLTNFGAYNSGGDGMLIINSSHTFLSGFAAQQNAGIGIHVGCASGCIANTSVKIGDANLPPFDLLTQNTGDGLYLDTSEVSSADQIFVLYSTGNTGYDLHDASANCGNNHWIANPTTGIYGFAGSKTNAGGVSNPSCMNPKIPPMATVTLDGTPTVSAVSGATSLTGSLSFTGGSLHSGDIAGCWMVVTGGVSSIGGPSGWTAQPNTNLNTPAGRITNLFTHVWNNGDTLSPVFTFTNSGSGEAMCFAYTNQNASIPISASKGMTNVASTTMTSPSIAPGYNNGQLLMLYAADTNGTVSNPSIGTIRQSEGNNGRELALIDTPFTTGTATGNQTVQISTSTGSVGVQVTIPNLGAPTPTPTVTPTPTPTPSPTPTPGVPPPPTLSNPQVIQPGAVFGGHTISGNGTSDDTAAFTAAIATGDLDIKPGTYSIDGQSTGITPRSGRNIYCENPSLPPTPGNATVIIKVPTAPNAVSSNWNVFQNWSNGTLYGCEVQLYHYPNLTWTADTGQSEGFVTNYGVNTNLHVIANDFNGMPGFVGVINITDSYANWSSGVWDSNDIISYNRFSHCNLRTTEMDYCKGCQSTHNIVTDCTEEPEIQDSRETGDTILYDSNTYNMDSNLVQAGGGGLFNFDVSGGNTCHTPGGGFPCVAGTNPAADYSGVTFSNNGINTSIPFWLVESYTCVSSGDQIIAGVYRGNTCGTNCTILCPPGNPSGNSWGAGSNQ